MYKYQAEFAAELAANWLAGDHEQVGLTIRQLKNKAQAAYIAAQIVIEIMLRSGSQAGMDEASRFTTFIHPNE